MVTGIETHTSLEDKMSRAARLSEVLGNLPPQCSVSFYSVERHRDPAAVPRAPSSRGRTAAFSGPMADVNAGIGCSVEEMFEVRKRSLVRKGTFVEGCKRAGSTAEGCFSVELPLSKRRRVPVRRTRAAGSVIAEG